ncbi:MAG: RND transporter [Gammaproteobacteria bacterium]|nr:RND transporter [Gammaproteobacteria bacterium]
MKFIDNISLGTWLVIALTLGLAPFVPEPHVWEKLKMLSAGTLSRPIDIFDILLHGTPWIMLALKLVRMGLLQRRA